MLAIHLWWALTSTTSPLYALTSGPLGALGLFGGGFAWYRLHECHIDSCHKFGGHPFKHYRLCRKHHPDVPALITHLHMVKLHKGDT